MRITSLTKKVVTVAVGAAVVTGLAVAPATAAPKKGLKIAIIPKSINNGYFTAWNKGAQKACKEFGASCKYIGPTQATGPAQVAFINQAIQQGYNAILLSAADQNALAPALKKAKARGICVVTSDADVKDTKTRTASVLPASSDRIGAAEVDWIAEELGKKGEVAILSAAATAANQNTWIEAMKKQFAKYPDMKLVGVYYGDDDATQSAQQFNQILTEHPNIAGIISPTTVGIRATPPPFVLQTALNDFNVTYELNAYTELAPEMAVIYSRLHCQIQEQFAAAGVEIMSPGYLAIRDGNARVLPARDNRPEKENGPEGDEKPRGDKTRDG